MTTLINKMARMLTIFSLACNVLTVSANVLTKVTDSIAYRDYYEPSSIWDNVTICLSNVTDLKMIIDKSYYGNRVSVTTIWVDSGANDADSIDPELAMKLVKCVKDNTGSSNVHAFGHNPYAAVASYEDHVYDEFYGYFGHGYPQHYEKDYESDGNPDDTGDIDGSLVAKGNGKWLDKIVPNQGLHWAGLRILEYTMIETLIKTTHYYHRCISWNRIRCTIKNWSYNLVWKEYFQCILK